MITPLGWVTIVVAIAAMWGLWRFIRFVLQQFPVYSTNGEARVRPAELQLVEYWNGVDQRVTRLDGASSRGRHSEERWAREITPLAAAAGRVKAERLGVQSVPVEIPDRWSRDWLDEQCSEMEHHFGLPAPLMPQPRVGIFRRLMRRIKGQ